MKSQQKNKRIVRSINDLKKPLKINDFYNKRNKVLIIRGVGGLGDILMHRMMFEDFKKLAPDVDVHFACPKKYHDVVSDHPYIDKILDVRDYNLDDYMCSYITSTCCGRYEMKMAPYSGKHRSDIWANYCGVTLTNHEMHINLTEEEENIGREILEEKRDRSGPIVLISPISAMEYKDLLDHQLLGTVEKLHDMGCCVIGLHNQIIFPMLKNDIPFIYGINLRKWLAVINQADYVISVDSSAFHAAGGMKKPSVGIFTFADGKVYNRYYDSFIVQKHRDDGNWDCGPCYNWGTCRQKKGVKPCLTEITVDDIMNKVHEMFEKCPSSNSI